MAEETGVLFLGSIPIDPKVSMDSDKGSPFAVEHAGSSTAEAFIEIGKKVDSYLKAKENTKP